MPFYIYKNNEQTGPHEDAAVEEGLRAGKFSPLDLASRDGASGWESLSTFFPFISQSRSSNAASQPPPPPVQASSPPPPSPYTWAQDSQPSAANQPYQAKPFGAEQPAALLDQPYQPPPIPQPAYQFPVAPSASGSLPVAGMVLGIVTAVLMVIGLVPCLGWLNWLTLTIGSVAAIVAFIAIVTEKDERARNKAIIGLVLALIALFIGAIRLAIGGGCL